MKVLEPTHFQWDASLETGFEKVDRQHKLLMLAARDLEEATLNGKSDKVVMETLEFLANYVVKHFTDEEQLQIDYGYPDYLTHKQIHEDFKVTVGKFVERINMEGLSAKLSVELCSLLDAWLLHHIKGDDSRMAAFVKEADARAMAEAEAEKIL